MKAIVCEMCGSNDLIKRDGVYICQNCGTKYTVEEAKNLLVEVDQAKTDISDDRIDNYSTNEVINQDKVNATHGTNDSTQQLPANSPTNNKTIIIGLVLLLLVAGFFILFDGGSNNDNTRWRAYNGVEYAAKNSSNVDISLVGIKETELIISKSGKVIMPNGKFVIVSVYIFNDSDKPISIGDSIFQIWDKAQRKYDVSTDASLAFGKKSTAFIQHVNPRMDILLELPFDVPKNLDVPTSWFHAKGGYKGDSVSLPLKVVTKNKNSDTNNQGGKGTAANSTTGQSTTQQNLANSGGSAVPSQNSADEYYGSDIYPPGSMRYRITGTDVNMRSGPGREHNVIGSFDKGEIVVEIDNEMSKKDTWIQCRRKNGNVGWVSGNYCEMVKDPKINYPNYIAAATAVYEFHDAITKKDYKKAYNLLAPEAQKTASPPDQWGQGYSNVISWTVMETNPISTDGTTVSIEYLLEAKNQLSSGIAVEYKKGFADLQKFNGEWKIVQESVGRGNVDRKTLLR